MMTNNDDDLKSKSSKKKNDGDVDSTGFDSPRSSRAIRSQGGDDDDDGGFTSISGSDSKRVKKLRKRNQQKVDEVSDVNVRVVQPRQIQMDNNTEEDDDEDDSKFWEIVRGDPYQKKNLIFFF
jgi:hypothetical protein